MELNFLDQQASAFYSSLSARAGAVGIDIAAFRPDHLCYRVETVEEYHLAKTFFLKENELLTEAEIRGRPIATFRLKRPLKFGSRQISLLELPAPHASRTFKTGFEHVEYVIDEPFEFLRDRYPALRDRFEIRDNPFNPELVLQFEDSSVKFHYQSLDKVIEIEELPLWKKQMVVFDLDGTLIDSVSQIAKVNRSLLQKLGVPESRLQITEFPSNFPELLKRFSLLEMDCEEFAEQWGAEMLKAPCLLSDGAYELLEGIKKLGIPMTIWTARDRPSALATLEVLGIGHFFKRVWGFKNSFSKPQPEGIRFLSEGRPAELVSFIGDSAIDAAAAEKFGCQFFWAHDVLKSRMSGVEFIQRIADRRESLS